MRKFSSLNPDEQRSWNEWKDERENQLIRQIEEAGNRAIQFVVLANGGSAIALAAFMGASAQVQMSSLAWAAQQFFLTGLMAAGACLAYRYHFFVFLFTRLKKDVFSIYKDELDTAAAYPRDDGRARYSWIGEAIAYLSFVCFLCGAYNAAYRLPSSVLALSASTN